ncbi:ArnT family glycosyltransferase [Chloroflexota bacterium]
MLAAVKQYKRFGYFILVGIFALSGFGIVLYSTLENGAGIWPDSVVYISVARNLIEGNGFIMYDGSPLILWPPLYSILLAIFGKVFGADPLVLVPLINALTFGLVVFFAGLLILGSVYDHPILIVAGLVIVMFSNLLFPVAVMALSDLLFVLITIISLYLVGRYLNNGNDKNLILFSISATLSPLSRYIGLVLIIWGCLIICFHQKLSRKKKIKHLPLFLIISTVPISIWAIRNYILDGSFFGIRQAPIFKLGEILSFGISSITSWYFTGGVSTHISISILVIVFCIFGIWLGLRGLNLLKNVETPKANFLLFSDLLVIIYLGSVILYSMTRYIAVNDMRTWSPIFIPLTLILLIMIRRIFDHQQNSIIKVFIFALVALNFVFWLVFQIPQLKTHLSSIRTNGYWLSDHSWKSSQTIQFLRENTLECKVYSNAPDVIYILADKETNLLPGRGNESIDVTTLKGQWPQEDQVCLVWFTNISRRILYTKDELLSITNMENFKQFDDGVLYVVSRK